MWTSLTVLSYEQNKDSFFCIFPFWLSFYILSHAHYLTLQIFFSSNTIISYVFSYSELPGIYDNIGHIVGSMNKQRSL